MHIFFSGIGGTAISPLAMIAQQAGYTVSGSDKRDSQYIYHLRHHDVTDIHIGQSYEQIAAVHAKSPIDWYVYSSAVVMENPDAPELKFCEQNGIKISKRDELLTKILKDKDLKLIAIAGTHGKTTTTAMTIWLFQQIGIPVSYSVGAKISFGEMGHYHPASEYFVYEADEFDRNFLAFQPYMALITGVDWDHHEIFPTREDYQAAFQQFLSQSERAVLWQSDVDKAHISSANAVILDDSDPILNTLSIKGYVNRRNAWQVMHALHQITGKPIEDLVAPMAAFPGISRRFEQIAPNLYSDYAHTIEKIRGCLQQAFEYSEDVVVVYEPLTDRRQHYIKEDYKDLFKGVKKLYWVPSYLAREDPNQTVLSPAELISYMDNSTIAEAADMNEQLKSAIQGHIDSGDLVVCLSGGGGASLDEWIRKEFK